MPVAHGAAVEFGEQAIMVHQVKGVLIVAKCVQGSFTNSLNEAYEGMGRISAS